MILTLNYQKYKCWIRSDYFVLLWSLLDHLVLPSWWPIKSLLGPWQSWITCWPRCDSPSHNQLMTTFGSPNDNLMSNWRLLYEHVVTTCFSFFVLILFRLKAQLTHGKCTFHFPTLTFDAQTLIGTFTVWIRPPWKKNPCWLLRRLTRY